MEGIGHTVVVEQPIDPGRQQQRAEVRSLGMTAGDCLEKSLDHTLPRWSHMHAPRRGLSIFPAAEKHTSVSQ
jgi:hypothetical protein